MIKAQLNDLDLPYKLNSHRAHDLVVDSQALQDNPLKDSTRRHNYVLSPKNAKAGLPVIFHLSGYFSTGYQTFAEKTLNVNFVQQVDQLVHKKEIPQAHHVFVEATTFWGGSQFINSAGCGRYEDYILKELYPAVAKQFAISDKLKHSCVMGGSSGGYGALSLVSQKKSPFGLAFATAPDSFFQASLLTELFQAAPELAKYKRFSEIKKLIGEGEIQQKKSFFSLVNVIAMAHCYSPKSAFKDDFIDFPIDLHSGEMKSQLWKEWLKHDPVHFLKKRTSGLKGKEIHLDVGKYDNFSLQFGARQIRQILKEAKVKHQYSEFPGNHFGLSARRLLFLQELKKLWRSFV